MLRVLISLYYMWLPAFYIVVIPDKFPKPKMWKNDLNQALLEYIQFCLYRLACW